MSNGVALSIKSMKKTYGSGAKAVTALRSVDLDIYENEFFTLLGPSGCGKTTLLRIIAGFEAATEGQLYLFSENVRDTPAHKRRVNTVFQSYALFPHMTIEENISFGLRMLGKKAGEIKEIVARMLALVQLEALAMRKPSELSGGQRQRIALARALATSPKVLLLDEPLSALDYKLRKDMQRELKRIQKETGITFVFVTHDQEEAMSMSDRIAVVAEGKIQQLGDPETIYEQPKNSFVANFIGEMNLFDVNWVKDGTEYVGKISDGLECRRSENPGTHLVGIRPEKIDVSECIEGMTANATVEEATYKGSVVVYRLKLLCGKIAEASFQQNARNAHVQVGRDVCVNFPAMSMRLIEAQSA